jgi:hypothetical protein
MLPRLILTKRRYGSLIGFIGLNVSNWLNWLNWFKDVERFKHIYQLKQAEWVDPV